MAFVTLSRTSPEFKSYLLGTFSKTHRAKFSQSLLPHVETEISTENVTFEIVPISEIKRPTFFVFIYQWLRINRLVFVLFPFLFMAINVQEPVFDPMLMFIGVLALIFLTWSIHLQNDYSDHMTGLDRYSLNSGSRAIQKGWVTAFATRTWSWIFGAGALILGGLILIGIPKLTFLALLVGSLIYFSHYAKQGLFKTKTWGGWLQGLLVGPCLSIGLEVLLTGTMTLTGLAFGFAWGTMILFVLFLNEFENLVPAVQAGARTWIGTLGFDRGREFLFRWWLLVLFATGGFHVIERPWILGAPGLVVLVYFSGKFLKNLRCLTSPAGSGMIAIRNEGYLLFMLAVTLWTTEEIFFNFVKGILFQ
ncbi:MAG: UbiA family prenyltransferase [Bdellovibrionaceae bacterium]|nr:UbiA family prenyltransferase [Pseudobdellovibrionaceae bacterium]